MLAVLSRESPESFVLRTGGNFNAIAAALTGIQTGNIDFQAKLNLLFFGKKNCCRNLKTIKSCQALISFLTRRRRPREVAPKLCY